jgi:hypothetical protein
MFSAEFQLNSHHDTSIRGSLQIHKRQLVQSFLLTVSRIIYFIALPIRGGRAKEPEEASESNDPATPSHMSAELGEEATEEEWSATAEEMAHWSVFGRRGQHIQPAYDLQQGNQNLSESRNAQTGLFPFLSAILERC